MAGHRLGTGGGGVPPPPFPFPRMDLECASGCTWSTARATARLRDGRPPGVVKQDKSFGGSVDTTKPRSDPQRIRVSSGERPIGAAKGKQSDTQALCQAPPPPLFQRIPADPLRPGLLWVRVQGPTRSADLGEGDTPNPNTFAHVCRAARRDGGAFCSTRQCTVSPSPPLLLAPGTPPLKDVLEGLMATGGPLPPPPRTPQTKVSIVGKNEIYNAEHLVGPFLVLPSWPP